MTGYMHPGYAESLAEFGTPRELPRSGGWLLERAVPDSESRDAMGCYPLFACRNWSALRADLDDLENELVSVALVTDPFGDYDRATLEECFDIVIPFKQHFIADLSEPPETIASKHHRKYARKAFHHGDVQVCSEPLALLDEWIYLYDVLQKRHHITGLRAFSRTAFEKQLALPGLVALRAECQSKVAAVDLFFVQGDVAYNHLTAVSETGYKCRISYALKWCAMQHFMGKVRWIDWGGSTNLALDDSDGLTMFKRGWARMIRSVYLCGSILDKATYRKVAQARNLERSQWFPAYREGEFT